MIVKVWLTMKCCVFHEKYSQYVNKKIPHVKDEITFESSLEKQNFSTWFSSVLTTLLKNISGMLKLAESAAS